MAREQINDNALINPSTGIFARNPTRVEITSTARDQQEIAQAVKGSQKKIGRVVYEYKNINKKDPPPLFGILNIRDMTEPQLVNFFKNALRSKPNIIKLHISLGEYKGAKRLNNSKTSRLEGNIQRYYSEVAENIAEIFADYKNKVVELIYTVNLNSPGYFNTTAEVYYVSEEEYRNDELFSPVIGLEYIEAI